MRLWVENWRRVGPELERIKRAELRALTEKEAYERSIALAECLQAEHWINPKRITSSGLIEQQAIFSRGRDGRS